MKKSLDYLDFTSKFPTEEAAIDYYFNIRYGGIITCPHCGAIGKVYRYRNRPKACHCKNCNNSFSPFKGTIFEKTTTDMRLWFNAIRQFIIARKGVSALQLQRDFGLTYKTAERMEQQIRLAMEDEGERKALSGVVEVDETYVGGKGQKYPKSRSTGEYLPKTKKKRGRGTKHPVVMGIKERGSGNVYTQVMPFEPSVKGTEKRLSGPQLKAVIDGVCEEGTTVISDDFKGYNILDKKRKVKVQLWLLDGEEPPVPYVHHTVNHKAGRFTSDSGPGIHTNGIESHWALLKRGFHGTFHSVSEKHLPEYLDEFSFRQNTRELSTQDAFDLLLKRSILKSP
jgi:transposase-like protein